MFYHEKRRQVNILIMANYRVHGPTAIMVRACVHFCTNWTRIRLEVCVCVCVCVKGYWPDTVRRL